MECIGLALYYMERNPPMQTERSSGIKIPPLIKRSPMTAWSRPCHSRLQLRLYPSQLLNTVTEGWLRQVREGTHQCQIFLFGDPAPQLDYREMNESMESK